MGERLREDAPRGGEHGAEGGDRHGPQVRCRELFRVSSSAWPGSGPTSGKERAPVICGNGAQPKTNPSQKLAGECLTSWAGGLRAPPVSLWRSVRSGIFSLAPLCERELSRLRDTKFMFACRSLNTAGPHGIQ